MDTSLKSNFFGKHTFTYKKVNKYSTKNKTFATKPIRDTRVSLSPFWSINEYVSNYWDINSALVFVLMIVDRIKYHSDSFNENSLIVNAKKYCWVKKVWNKRVQLIKLLFNFSRNNMRFFYLILNEFLFPKEFIHKCNSKKCLEDKPYIFRNINITGDILVNIWEGETEKKRPFFGNTCRIHLCKNCIEDWICSSNCNECINSYNDNCDYYYDCKKNVKSLVCSLRSISKHYPTYLQIYLDKDEYPEIYEKNMGKFKFPNGYLDKSYYPEWKKNLVYWGTHDPNSSGPEM